MSVSTVPTLKRTLRAQLQARAGLTGVEVSYGVPRSHHLEWVWLAGVTNHILTPTGMHAGGTTPVEEEYDLSIVLHVEQAGRDQETCDERLYALVAEIQAQLQEDPQVNATFGTSGGAARLSEIPAMEPSLAGDGVRSRALLNIHVNAHQQ